MVKQAQRYQEGDYLFDGFAHRPYNEDIDGHLNTRIDPNSFFSVRLADEIYAMVDEINTLRRQNWELEQRLKRWEKR